MYKREIAERSKSEPHAKRFSLALTAIAASQRLVTGTERGRGSKLKNITKKSVKRACALSACNAVGHVHRSEPALDQTHIAKLYSSLFFSASSARDDAPPFLKVLIAS